MKFCMKIIFGGIQPKKTTKCLAHVSPTPTTLPTHPETTPNKKLWQFQSDFDQTWWGGVI